MYNLDRRKIATSLYFLLKSLRKSAIILNVSHSTISRWLKNPERKIYKRAQVTKSSQVIESIKICIQLNPFISICQLRHTILETLKIHVSRELVRTCILKLGMSRKKARFFGQPKNLKEKTNIFIEKRKQYIDEGRVFFSLDETSFGRNGKQMMGYAPIGKQLRIMKCQPTMTTISSLVIASKQYILKRQEIQGSFNTTSLLHFLTDIEFPKQSVLLLDNVSFHHSKQVKELAYLKELTLLYTPPYSPWFNPIEGIFSIVKRSFYKHGNVNKAFNSVTPNHCLAFFKKSLNEQIRI